MTKKDKEGYFRIVFDSAFISKPPSSLRPGSSAGMSHLGQHRLRKRHPPTRNKEIGLGYTLRILQFPRSKLVSDCMCVRLREVTAAGQDATQRS